MERVKKATDEAMDSLKQGQQEKQTGSPEFCQTHNTEMCLYMGKMICQECDTLKNDAGMAHYNLNLPKRFMSCSLSSFKAKNPKAEKIKSECEKYIEDWSEESGSIVMLGSVGTGKTHLAVSLCKRVCDLGKTAHMTTIPMIIRAVRSSWGGKGTDQWGSVRSEEDILRDYSQKYSLLVIDEIGSQYGSDSEKIIISEIINNRYNNCLPTIIIGNVTFSEAEEYLGKRVIDRIKDGGMILIFDWESHRSLK